MSLKVEVHREDERGNVFRLLEPMTAAGVTVPAGFESDGASVPRFFWRAVFPPGDAHALRAAFVHDWLYRNGSRAEEWSGLAADRLFYRLLLEDGVPPLRAWMAYSGVRLFGKRNWIK